MRHLLTKGTANRILRLKTGQILLKTAQLTHENLSFSTHQLFKCPSNWKIKPNERALLVAGGFQQHPQWLHTKPCLLRTVKDMLGPGRERGHQNSLKIKKKKETCTTFSQKEKGFQAKRVALPSESHWQFLQRSSPRWNWSIYTVLSRLKAPAKRYWNDSTSEQWSAKPAWSRPESPRAWQVLLCGCQQIFKGRWVSSTVQLEAPLHHSKPSLLTRTGAAAELGRKRFSHQPRAPSDAVTLMRFRNKHTQNLEKKK